MYPNGTSSPSSRVALGGWSTFRRCVLDALFVALVIILVFLVLREACKLVVVVVVVVVTVDLDFANEEDDEEANIVVREDADGRPAEEEEEDEARINLDDGAQSMILFLFLSSVCACLRVRLYRARRRHPLLSRKGPYTLNPKSFEYPKRNEKKSLHHIPLRSLHSARMGNERRIHRRHIRTGTSSKGEEVVAATEEVSFGGGVILSAFSCPWPLKNG